jgi:ubiquinone biosynthesis monooxygenase Coq6
LLRQVKNVGASPKTANLKIALVEGQELDKTSFKAESPTFSNRCSSLTPASVKFLTDIGAWQHVATARLQPYQAMHVWDGVSGSSITFDPQAQHTNTVATMTENPNLTSALLKHLDSLPPIDVMHKTRVDKIELGTESEQLDLSNWPVVSLSNSRKLAARLLIGADGANSPVRTFAGIPSRGWDYNRHGLVATVDLEHANINHQTAYQRFLPTGPIALLPLPGNKASLVWSTTPENAAILKSLSTSDTVAMINAAFRLLPVDLAYMHTIPNNQSDEFTWRQQNTLSSNTTSLPPLITAIQPNSLASFPLRMRHADTYTAHRIALLGDAAHTIHPLAGQGLNQGLADAQSLAKHVHFALSTGKDIGSNWALDAYNAEQWIKNNAMLGAVDKLHKLYSAESGPVVWARSLGLSAVDKMDFLKGFLMKRAAGL